MSNSYKVIDFFCGAGGFSEGFRQQGFDIIKGIDFWQLAIDSHNLNHHLSDTIKNVLDFWGKDSSDVSDAISLPDAEVIIGSPSCVSFSMSNKAGKADKSDGVKLIEAFLRVIAVQKTKPNSVLKAWYMENVPESEPHIKKAYTFQDLNLAEWALALGRDPNESVISIQGETLNAGDYGAPQNRKRYIVGEWVETAEYLHPEKMIQKAVTIEQVRSEMPPPNLKITVTPDRSWRDPNYPSLEVSVNELTDHFYDTGLYTIEWEKAEHLKTNHPFMGKMSFPEDGLRSCRTIMATRSASTREAIIFKSEYNRTGNGEYRLPTIREIATFMGYPYCYQFLGTESGKWRQIGNSVSPHLSTALARAIRVKAGLPIVDIPSFLSFKGLDEEVSNLNTFTEKKFDTPKCRKVNARFRRHPLKRENMTVELLNYHPDENENVGEKWYVASFYGTGLNHKVKVFNKEDINILKVLLEGEFPQFRDFETKILEWEKLKINTDIQKIYENDLNLEDTNNPINLVKEMTRIIQSFPSEHTNKLIPANNLFPKNLVPISHVMTSYALHKLT